MLLCNILKNFQASVRHDNITGSLGHGDGLDDLLRFLPIFCDSRKITGIIVLPSTMMDERLESQFTSLPVIKALKLCLFDLVLNTVLQVGVWKNKTLQLNVALTKGRGYALHLTSHF